MGWGCGSGQTLLERGRRGRDCESASERALSRARSKELCLDRELALGVLGLPEERPVAPARSAFQG